MNYATARSHTQDLYLPGKKGGPMVHIKLMVRMTRTELDRILRKALKTAGITDYRMTIYKGPRTK